MCLLRGHNLNSLPDVFWFVAQNWVEFACCISLSLNIAKVSIEKFITYFCVQILVLSNSFEAQSGLVCAIVSPQSLCAVDWYREIWSRSRRLTWNLCLSLSLPFLLLRRRRWSFCADNDGFDCDVPWRFPDIVRQKVRKSGINFDFVGGSVAVLVTISNQPYVLRCLCL